MEQNAGASSQISGVYVRDAARDSAQGFLHGAERWQSFCVWLSTQTRSVPTRSASGSLRQTWPWREGLYYGALAPAFPPVVPNFFTTRKCQGWRVLFFFFFIDFTPRFPFPITRLSSWLRALGKSWPGLVQKHVCAISHSIKIYLPSKHSRKWIPSGDLNSRLAVPFQIPALICDTGRISISALWVLSGERNWPIKAAEASYHPCAWHQPASLMSSCHTWMAFIIFFFIYYKHNVSGRKNEQG